MAIRGFCPQKANSNIYLFPEKCCIFTLFVRSCSIFGLNDIHPLSHYAFTSKNFHLWSIPAPHPTIIHGIMKLRCPQLIFPCCLISVDILIVLVGYPPSHTSHMCVKWLPRIRHFTAHNPLTTHPSSHICKLWCSPPPLVFTNESENKTNQRQTTCGKVNMFFMTQIGLTGQQEELLRI